MDKFVINGGHRLKGRVKIDGSKNAALPIIFGALLIDKGESVIKNVPPLRDVHTAIRVMEYLGAKVTYDARRCVMTVKAGGLNQNTAPYELMRQMRASFLALGPILARLGEARVSLPGGCVLGARPVNFHVAGFRALGAKVSERSGYVVAKGKPLKGGVICFDRPSHTGTENLLYGAVMAKGRTTLVNAACDPEVVDVANFLNQAGARIHGAGTPTIVIDPVRRLKPVEYTVSGDRLVAGTYLMAGAITGGNIKITGCASDTLTVVLHKLQEMGCRVDQTAKSVTLKAPRRLKPVAVTTFPYPGFPTDLQACIMAAGCVATETSHVTETVFEDRFSHTMEMRRLGAKIAISSNEAVITGVKELHGAEVMASDIRAGAGIVLACLAARGQSEVLRVYHIDRGYHRLEEKLSSLGADIRRIGA
ncbi:MAG: UDP-N-acetylglucosamine 1-carboxyvinyltransferase [candidate division Zixibacteria bacterium]|nr:UDP-N-acetylglucosamine 1-carboxyvinyltransferase [candidate division Zixibacteria bacterium]